MRYLLLALALTACAHVQPRKSFLQSMVDCESVADRQWTHVKGTWKCIEVEK